MRAMLFRCLRATSGDRRGVAAVEFALISTVLLTLLIGAVDVGNAVQLNIRLAQAARAGGQYAMSYPAKLTSAAACPATSSTSPAAPNSAACAINQALPTSWSSDGNTTITITCKCWSSATGYSTPATCSSVSICSSGTTQRFVIFQVTRPYSTVAPPAAYAFTPLSGNASISYQIRVQ